MDSSAVGHLVLKVQLVEPMTLEEVDSSVRCTRTPSCNHRCWSQNIEGDDVEHCPLNDGKIPSSDTSFVCNGQVDASSMSRDARD